MGLYDMPPTIDYVLAETGSSKLHYVSLSMGPAAFLAGLVHRPEYNDKIASAVLMGPTVFMANFYNGATYFLSPAAKYLRV
jgi:pimeloyl-ACP methyl ester carboxylesterase